jgi:hypothetical protein
MRLPPFVATSILMGCGDFGLDLVGERKAQDPILQSSPGQVDFGRVPIGALEEVSVELYSGEKVGIYGLSVLHDAGGVFSASTVLPLPAVLSAQSRIPLTVGFLPDSEGSFSADLLVEGDIEELLIGLSGIGCDPDEEDCL